MSYKDPAYVIFDGDEDKWAYGFMQGWKKNDKIDFDFRDAHELDSMTPRAQNEEYVKKFLKERMGQSKSAIVLVGDKTKNLYRYIRWELELALSLDLPIIAVNLNDERKRDKDLCPPIIRDKCVVHVPFRMKIIKYALDNWPSEYKGLTKEQKAGGARNYAESVYKKLDL